MAGLKNVSKRNFVANLPHDVACKDECSCDLVEFTSRELDGQSGEYGIKRTEREICGSIHLGPGLTVEVSDAVLDVPAVAKALAKGVLRSV